LSTTPSQELRLNFERRKGNRSDLTLPVIVSSGSKDYRARLINIAPMGAMLEVSAPLIEGASVFLRCGSIDAHAVVIWIRGLRMGIKFSAPLSERQIAEQLCRAAAAASLKSRMPLAVAANDNGD
jgi:hypothetical protein